MSLVKSKSSDTFEILSSDKIDTIKYAETKDVILLIKFKTPFPKGKFSFTMNFKVWELDEDGEEQNIYDDTYPLDPVIFSIIDYMTP